jgi:HEAT repeat protein
MFMRWWSDAGVKFKLLPSLFVVLNLITGPRADQNAYAAEQTHLDSPMLEDPLIDMPKRTWVFAPDLIPLWLKALAQPQIELQQKAADTIVLAHRRGMEGLEATAEPLIAEFQQGDLAPVVQRAIARALIELDRRDTATMLWQAVLEGDVDLAKTVEPALARWDVPDAREVWLQRLEDPGVDRARLLLAIRALGSLREKRATDALFRIVVDRDRWPALRLTAAHAMSDIHDSGLLDKAEQLASSSEPNGWNRVLAVALVRRHRQEPVIGFFQTMATDSLDPVAAESVQALAEIDPELVFKTLPDAARHRDVRVRETAAQVLIGEETAAAVRALGPLLDDTNPPLRVFVAESLVELAALGDLRETVIDVAGEMVNSDRWRGIEQATVVMVRLDQKQICDRMVELLEHWRPEVYTTSAWALRNLQVARTLPDMLSAAERQYEPFAANEVSQAHYDYQVEKMSQLFQAFGQQRYQPADALCRKYVPKNFGLGDRARMAACWALGYIHENNAPPDLSEALVGRLSDLGPPVPEAQTMRMMCAISLGRMNSESALPALREFAKEGPDSWVGQACGWAIEQITGEPRPMPKPRKAVLQNWFLTPLR